MRAKHFLTAMSIVAVGFLSTANFDANAASSKIQRLSAANVSAFIEDTSAMTSNKNLDRDKAKISAYLDRHIHPKARFKSNMRFITPGMPEQERMLSLRKDDYIKNIEQGAEAIDHYHTEITIDDLKLSKNKKSASVTTTSLESGIMQVPDQQSGGIKEVPIEGKSECFQVLKLSRKGYIQMYSANCTTSMRFLDN